MRGRLIPLGGVAEVGANSHFLEVAGTRLLLDAGLHPKRSGADALPALDGLAGEEVEHILVTHAHLDHAGALPVVLQRFPRARIHATPATARFAVRMLRNAVNVAERKGDGRLYDYDHVDWVAEVIQAHAPGEPFALGRRGLRATFFDAGHIPGAAGALLEDGAETCFYTGDTCAAAQSLIPGASYPSGPIDLVLSESTYGTEAERPPRVRLGRDLVRALADTLAGGGCALLPAFALGRAQEMLVLVATAIGRQELPPVPVYLTGLARAFARLYDQTRFVTPRCDPELRLERLPFQVLEPEAVDSGVPLERPSLLIASSGMVLPNTASSRLARRMLPEPRHAVFFVGYLDPDTPGHRVAEAPPGADVDLGDGLPPVPVCCRVERFRFGAHSSRRSLLGMLDGLRPGRLALVHGEPAAADALAAAAGDSTRMVALQIDRETVWD